MVVLLWLFVVLIINSSYTASLTSILTVQKLSTPITGIESLIQSREPIGYQENTFVNDYLVGELGIQASRLIPFSLPEEYEKALIDGPHNGGVAAIVDQRSYIELFLSTRCEFSIVGQEFTKTGWGFVSWKSYILLFSLRRTLSYKMIDSIVLLFCLITGLSTRLSSSSRYVDGYSRTIRKR